MNDIWAIGDRPNKVRADNIRPYETLSQINAHALQGKVVPSRFTVSSVDLQTKEPSPCLR